MNKNLIILAVGVIAVLGFVFISNNKTNTNSPVAAVVAESWFTEYSEEALSAATENGRAVIFFHAGWCSTCLAAAKDFEANVGSIPEDVTILKANFDTETELKAKYGVTYQDTFVQVDSDGEVMALWNSGGRGLNALLNNVI